MLGHCAIAGQHSEKRAGRPKTKPPCRRHLPDRCETGAIWADRRPTARSAGDRRRARRPRRRPPGWPGTGDRETGRGSGWPATAMRHSAVIRVAIDIVGLVEQQKVAALRVGSNIDQFTNEVVFDLPVRRHQIDRRQALTRSRTGNGQTVEIAVRDQVDLAVGDGQPDRFGRQVQFINFRCFAGRPAGAPQGSVRRRWRRAMASLRPRME